MTESTGQRFRRLREGRGLTRRDVSQWLKMSMGEIVSFERGWHWRHNPKLLRLERYWAYADCRALLIGGDRRLAKFPEAA